MQREFERYRLKKLRVLTGVLQVLASLVLLLGLVNQIFASLGALFLSVMMLVALFVRLRIRDPWLSMIPAAVYLAINLYILLSTSYHFF